MLQLFMSDIEDFVADIVCAEKALYTQECASCISMGPWPQSRGSSKVFFPPQNSIRVEGGAKILRI